MEPLTATGRTPGPKGMKTRRRLLEEVERRCVRSHYGTISVAEIAQAADTSAATFYHYFPDVAAAAAEVASIHLAQFDAVEDLARDVVDNHGEFDACKSFVRAFFDFWADRPGLIEAIVIASRNEDPRFFKVLLRALVSLTNTLAHGVTSGHAKGTAGSLVMMLSHAAARRDGFARDGVPLDELIASQAFIIHRALSDHA
jgi:AcrR family transcriptional regulator